jgi:hypothetical protein
VTCRFNRVPVRVTLFAPEDLTTPEVQKVAHEVYEWQRSRRLDEDQRIANRILFEHEPQNFAWCEGYTRKVNAFFTRKDAQTFRDELLRRRAEGARDVFYRIVNAGQDLEDAAAGGDATAVERLATIARDRMDPVSGEVIRYYVPAAYVNEDGGCDQWKERAD